MKRLVKLVAVLLLVLAGLAAMGHKAYKIYVWNQIEKQAVEADLAEGEQE